MKKYGLLLILSAGALVSVAQDRAVSNDKASSRWRFHSINTAGWISGKSGSAFQLQTINGLQKDRLFLGLGIGTDKYKYAGLPVFVDARLYTGQRSSAFFLYGDAGIHFVTEKETTRFYDVRYLNGFYSDIGGGYAISCGRRSAVEFSAGWTYKRVTRRTSYRVYTLGAPEYEKVDKFIYDLTRLVVKAGFRF